MTINANGLIIIHVNVQSIDAHFSEFEILVKNIKKQPDVIVCTETWHIKSINLYRLDGYKMYHSESKVTSADGVLVYVKNNLSTRVKIFDLCNMKILQLELTDSNKKKLK